MTTRDKSTPGKMKGGVRKRGSRGRWAFAIDLGPVPAQRCEDCNARQWTRPGKLFASCPDCGGALRVTEERRQEYRGGFATKSEAVHARADRVSDMGKGTAVSRDKITLRKYLVDEWLPALKGSKLRPATLASYTTHVKYHLAGTKLGDLNLQQMDRQLIAAHYARLLTDGRADGVKDAEGKRKPLSATTVRRIHATLHRALRDAVRSHLLPLNPATDMELPVGEDDGTERKLMAWDSSQLRTFLESVRKDRLSSLWLTYATTGARRGEILGLEWGDVDLTAARLAIRQPHIELARKTLDSKPKTDSGRRTIALDPATIAALKRHRTAQKVERLAAGPRWQESGHVFVDELGEPLGPSVVSRAFKLAVKAARQQSPELPVITLHAMRHTFATIALVERRLPVSMVSKRLGHKNEAVTLTMYAEVLPRYDEEAALDVASVIVPESY